VVESSLGVPTGCVGKLRWQTAGMFGEAAMAEPWDGVGKAAMANCLARRRNQPRWVKSKARERRSPMFILVGRNGKTLVCVAHGNISASER
jgi:hypothetical protein